MKKLIKTIFDALFGSRPLRVGYKGLSLRAIAKQSLRHFSAWLNKVAEPFTGSQNEGIKSATADLPQARPSPTTDAYIKPGRSILRQFLISKSLNLLISILLITSVPIVLIFWRKYVP